MEENSDATAKQRRDWREIWLELQEAQKAKLDEATYNQLLDLRPHLDLETMVYAFFTSSPLVSLALWSNTTRSPKNNSHEKALVDVSQVSKAVFHGAPPTSSKKNKQPHFTDTAYAELNLRRYRIQGGVYTIDLLEVPPQPRVLTDCTITQVEEVCTVSRVHWVAQYNPPAAPEAAGQRRRDPEAVEQEMRQLERELQKLLLITIKLPDSAFWFEPPQMVLWDEAKRCWSNEYFHDVKYNEDQCVMQVRTTRLGVMGLAMNRFANLPFQSWELKPQGPGAVSLTLIAAVVVADFTITEGQVCLANLQDGARTALSHLYGKPMKPNTLIKVGLAANNQYCISTLQFYGINLFPDRDSYCYIDGLPAKHRPTEQHLYRCLALVAPALHFAWSRWNLLAGDTKLVFQMKTKKLSADDTQVCVCVCVRVCVCCGATVIGRVSKCSVELKFKTIL
ncbi:Axonemal protein [Portunus trituberculatus]|uniref:Axonemal protein n=1 Tax=Portunus trituberculatus TaxID=210409 RepID=A0A5B7DHF4_PORTR|nr:Axonemal protein [Portunus trituberculatus]